MSIGKRSLDQEQALHHRMDRAIQRKTGRQRRDLVCLSSYGYDLRVQTNSDIYNVTRIIDPRPSTALLCFQ